MTAPTLLNYRYKILKALAEGGFGKTFLAEDTQMPSKRRCVIKQLKPVSSRPEIAQIVQDRFTREAAVLDAVGKDHDQIPTLYAYFVTAGKFYLVQEWVDGEPLQVASHKILPPEKAHQLMKDVLPAIAHVHSKNVIHRDIKPDNIIIRKADQLPCLIDFGAVKELMSTVVGPAGLPKSSIVIGTAGYMPREQAAGHPTFSSDLYSLAMTVICLMSGKYPATIPTDSRTGQLLWQQYLPNLNPALAKVLSKAIHPYPQNRYLSAVEMLAALSGPAANRTASIRPTAAPPNAASPTAAPPAIAATLPPFSYPTAETTSLSAQPVGAQPITQPVGAQAIAAQAIGLQPNTQPKAFPAKGAALTATAFALGATLLFAVSPKPEFDFGTDTSISDSESATATTVDTTSDRPNPEDIPEQPTTAADFTNRATLLYDEGRLQPALQDVDSALEIDSDSLEALSLKGDILVNQSRVDLPGAIAAYTQALAIDSNSPNLLQKRCTAHQNNKALDLAHQDCTQLLTLQPDNASAYDQRGDIRIAQGNYPAAIEDYTKAIDLNESQGNPAANQSIYYSRAQAYDKVGDPAKGLEDYDKMRSSQ